VLLKCYDKPKQTVSKRSSVCRLDLGFRVCHSAIRLLTEPYPSAEGRPENIRTTEGISAEERNRKYEAVQLQVFFFLKNGTFHSYKKTESAYTLTTRKVNTKSPKYQAPHEPGYIFLFPNLNPIAFSNSVFYRDQIKEDTGY